VYDRFTVVKVWIGEYVLHDGADIMIARHAINWKIERPH